MKSMKIPHTFPQKFYLLFRASSRAVTTSAGSGNFSLRGGPFFRPVHNTTSVTTYTQKWYTKQAFPQILRIKLLIICMHGVWAAVRDCTYQNLPEIE